MPDVNKRIKDFHARNTQWLTEIKYKLMAENAFRFFRGSCQLFYEDLQYDSSIPYSPIVWACGDLHIENFGSYRGDNGLVYFDINDFDECILAPLSYDLIRFISSVFLAFDSLKITAKEALNVARQFLKTFSKILETGSARYIERGTATGIVKKFLKAVEGRTRKQLIEEYTKKKNGKIKLDKGIDKHLEIGKELKTQLMAGFKTWMNSNNKPTNDHKVLDVCFRIAGTGSIGVERYLYLIQKCSDECEYMLIDQKEARPSSLVPHINIPQPIFESEAARVVAVQKRMQNIPPAQLSTMGYNNKSFIMQEMQPIKDRVNFELIEDDSKKVYKVMDDMAIIAASSYLSSSGRQGSCIADELVAFGAKNDWQQEIIDYALAYVPRVIEDYNSFKDNYKTTN